MDLSKCSLSFSQCQSNPIILKSTFDKFRKKIINFCYLLLNTLSRNISQNTRALFRSHLITKLLRLSFY